MEIACNQTVDIGRVVFRPISKVIYTVVYQYSTSNIASSIYYHDPTALSRDVPEALQMAGR